MSPDSRRFSVLASDASWPFALHPQRHEVFEPYGPKCHERARVRRVRGLDAQVQPNGQALYPVQAEYDAINDLIVGSVHDRDSRVVVSGYGPDAASAHHANVMRKVKRKFVSIEAEIPRLTIAAWVNQLRVRRFGLSREAMVAECDGDEASCSRTVGHCKLELVKVRKGEVSPPVDEWGPTRFL